MVTSNSTAMRYNKKGILTKKNTFNKNLSDGTSNSTSNELFCVFHL